MLEGPLLPQHGTLQPPDRELQVVHAAHFAQEVNQDRRRLAPPLLQAARQALAVRLLQHDGGTLLAQELPSLQVRLCVGRRWNCSD